MALDEHQADELEELDIVTVHSTRLGSSASVVSTNQTLYTVPAGKRTILKSVVATNFHSGTLSLYLYVKSGTTILFTYVLNLADATTLAQTKVDLPWIVLNAGEHIEAWASASYCMVALSGAELNLT